MTTARSVLQVLRDGDVPSPDAVYQFARDVGAGTVSDAQAGAFVMAVCLQALGDEGRVALTQGMRDSGDRLSWDVPGPVLDKHSTGGVGDAVSLMLAPLLAACGAFVPMISGRGLGHTGGTLDKLEAIPGVRTELAQDKFAKIVSDVGCAIVAPTRNIAPADKRLYGIRDVTGTVRSVDLITSSILAKKLAAGLDALVLDVKLGSGAVMVDEDAARDLAGALVETANGAGCPTTAFLTDMNQPVLPSVGNAVEVVDIMRGFQTGQGRCVELAVALGADLLVAGNLASSVSGATEKLQACLQSGHAQEVFGKMIAAQGGPTNFDDRWQDYLDVAPAFEIKAGQAGYVQSIDGQALGQATVSLGGGRQKETDRIDPSVGLSQVASLGQEVRAGDVLAVVHAQTDIAASQVQAAIGAAFVVGDSAPSDVPLIHDRISQ